MSEEPENAITEVTRRAIVDYLSVGRQWSGVFPEDGFLGRLYDLKLSGLPFQLDAAYGGLLNQPDKQESGTTA